VANISLRVLRDNRETCTLCGPVRPQSAPSPTQSDPSPPDGDPGGKRAGGALVNCATEPHPWPPAL